MMTIILSCNYGSYRTVEPFDPPTQNTITAVIPFKGSSIQSYLLSCENSVMVCVCVCVCVRERERKREYVLT